MSSSSQVPESWISAFCSLVGHEYFAEVSEDFIEDDFNLTGLQSQVPMYKEALEMILDVEPEDASDEEEEEEEEDEDEDEDDMNGDCLGRGYRRADAAAERRHLRMASDLSVIESSAEMLYGLIHQRFITSRPGIQQMAEKYDMGHFGHCPRVFCHGAKVLPVGCSDIPGHETVKLFCPSCLDVYSPPNSRFQTVDGAFFGTTFGCLFFMTFPDLEVGGQRPPLTLDPTSPSHAHHAERTARSSLSSSLTSPATGAAPTTSEHPPNDPSSSSAHWPTSASAAGSSSRLPRQPEIMNGVAPKNIGPGLGPGNIYEPRIYGFRVSEYAKTGPRMKWLRMRPLDINEVDECRLWREASEETAETDRRIAERERLKQQSQPQPQQSEQQSSSSRPAPVAVDAEMVDDGRGPGDAEDADMVEGGAADGVDGAGTPTAASTQRRGKQRMHTDAAPNGGTPLVNGESRGGPVKVGDGG